MDAPAGLRVRGGGGDAAGAETLPGGVSGPGGMNAFECGGVVLIQYQARENLPTVARKHIETCGRRKTAETG